METYSFPKGAALFERATQVIPGGIYGHLGPAEGCYMPISSYPLFTARAEGAYFWDVDRHREDRDARGTGVRRRTRRTDETGG